MTDWLDSLCKSKWWQMWRAQTWNVDIFFLFVVAPEMELFTRKSSIFAMKCQICGRTFILSNRMETTQIKLQNLFLFFPFEFLSSTSAYINNNAQFVRSRRWAQKLCQTKKWQPIGDETFLCLQHFTVAIAEIESALWPHSRRTNWNPSHRWQITA